MLELKFPEIETYDSDKNEFVSIPEETCIFMFNLVSLDKWERKYRKRFLDNPDITIDEYLDFFEIMCIEGNFDKNRIGNSEYQELISYIKDTPTATVLPKGDSKAGERKKIFTSEIIYAYMCLSGVPMEWENRNLNKLIMLLNTISSIQQPPKKMSARESAEEQSRIIEERRKQYENRGKR